jgi:hypothetical protein
MQQFRWLAGLALLGDAADAFSMCSVASRAPMHMSAVDSRRGVLTTGLATVAAALLMPAAALAKPDCMTDCTRNCNRVAPGSVGGWHT